MEKREHRVIPVIASPHSCIRFFMYAFMVSGISILMFIIHYVYTTTVRKVSNSPYSYIVQCVIV